MAQICLRLFNWHFLFKFENCLLGRLRNQGNEQIDWNELKKYPCHKRVNFGFTIFLLAKAFVVKDLTNSGFM